MKKSSLAFGAIGVVLATALATQTTVAQNEELERRARELGIMSHIFLTSLNDGGQQGRGTMYQQPKARYLAGQGAVFSFNLAGMRSFMGRNGFNTGDWEQFGLAMSRIGQEVAAQVVASFPDLDLDFDFDPDTIPLAPGRGMSVAERGQIEQMNEAMREQQRKVQDAQRQIRDLQREQQRGSEADMQEFASRLQAVENALQSQVAALTQQQQAYRDYMEQYQQQARAQEASANELMMGHILQALCDYGSTMKSLPANEHVTLVFENYQDDKEQIHVFTFKAVSDCTSVDALKRAAVSYLM